MPDLLVIADSGPLIALAGVQCLDLLPQLYRRVAAPRAVLEEIMAGAHLSARHTILHHLPWLEQLEAPVPLDALAIVLGRGEAEAIALARHHPGALLLSAVLAPMAGVFSSLQHLVQFCSAILVESMSGGQRAGAMFYAATSPQDQRTACK